MKTKPLSVELDIDAYGSKIRESAVADFLEAQALLHGRSYSKTELERELDNRDLLLKTKEAYVDLDPARASVREFAERVFVMLQDRKALLGGKYPFATKGKRVVLEVQEPRKVFYVGVLSLTLDHAYSLHGEGDKPLPEDTFEELVVSWLRSTNLKAEHLASLVKTFRGLSKPEKFRKGVGAVATSFGLETAVNGSILPSGINEDGVDAIACLPMGDSRHGQWVFIGQATCCKSDRWSVKIMEPKSEQWKKLLAETCKPFGFLAVPHHVTEHHLKYLVQNHAYRPVVDRIRLCHGLDSLSKNLTASVDRLMSVNVTPP